LKWKCNGSLTIASEGIATHHHHSFVEKFDSRTYIASIQTGAGFDLGRILTNRMSGLKRLTLESFLVNWGNRPLSFSHLESWPVRVVLATAFPWSFEETRPVWKHEFPTSLKRTQSPT